MINELSHVATGDPVPKMKITFVLPFGSLTGGIRVASHYATQLAARGHDVRVVSQPAPRRSLKDRLRAFAAGRALPRSIPSPLLEPLGSRHSVLPSCRPVVAGDLQDADFVIATWWETAEWVANLPASKGRKLYLLQDYEMFPYLPQDRVAATYDAGLRMIAVSSYIRTTIEERHGITGIDLLLNGVDTRHFDPPPRDRNLSMTVGFLFQYDERKNTPLALAAIEKARARVPNLRVKAFGSAPPRPEDPLPPYIEFERAPPQDRIPQIYAACDAWIVPSRNEGFGLPLLEAMACRTPVLATRFGASEDIVEDGRNGFLLPSDPDAFADKIALLRQMPHWDWKQMSDEARKTALHWTWEGRVDQLEHRLTTWLHE